MSRNPFSALTPGFGMQGLRPDWERALPDWMRDELDRERARQVWGQARGRFTVEYFERVGRVLADQPVALTSTQSESN
jgi:hypothetical protein